MITTIPSLTPQDGCYPAALRGGDRLFLSNLLWRKLFLPAFLIPFPHEDVRPSEGGVTGPKAPVRLNTSANASQAAFSAVVSTVEISKTIFLVLTLLFDRKLPPNL